jgi:hypothetical protein
MKRDQTDHMIDGFRYGVNSLLNISGAMKEDMDRFKAENHVCPACSIMKNYGTAEDLKKHIRKEHNMTTKALYDSLKRLI